MSSKKFSKFPPKKPDNSHIIKVAPKLNWSEYQKDIFRNIANGVGHTIVEARAGSSKTTSIIESFKYIPKGKKTLALAFNKIIQEELKSRAPSYIEVLTFHSIGFRAIKQRFGNVELNEYKIQNLIQEHLGDTDRDLVEAISNTIAYIKYSLEDSPKQIEEIINKFSIDICDTDINKFISMVISILALDKAQTNVIDFNDMCYFPFVYNLPLGQYDYVFVDESQDLNKSQLVMAKKACKNTNGRIIMVLDSYQALYSWRSADVSILESLKKEPDTKILLLPISYRCPKKVIELVKPWVSDITYPETAIDGEIKDISLNELYSIAKPGCFILSRTNAPMIKICMTFIRNGIRANIRGKDIGKQLNFLIKKSKKKQIKAFLTWLESWKDEEIEKLREKNINPENILDRYECLINICDECSSLSEVTSKINELFNDCNESNMIILSSVHRAKGLERDDVYLLKWTFRAWFDNTHLLDKKNEEANIAYVACTRARNKLFIVNKI